MKNVEEKFSKRPMFRVQIQGAPPPKGWAVKYVSGMEDKPDIKPGFWLTQFYVDAEGYINFNFDPVLDLRWGTEAQASEVSKALHDSAEIETAVVNIA